MNRLRAGCFILLLLAGVSSAQTPRANTTLPSLPLAEAEKALADFRSSGMTVDLIARFRLRHLPKRGPEPAALQGTLWMSWRHGRPAARIELAGRSTLLVRSEGVTRAWVAPLGSTASPIAQANEPLAPGFLLSAYDIQAPYADWPNTRYLGSERRRGRPLNLYLATAPEGTPPASVRLGLDRAYLALIEASTLGPDGKTLREMRTEEFAQVAEQWIVAKLSVREVATDNRDVLEVLEACVDARLPAQLFSPQTLGSKVPEVEGTFIRP